MSVYQVNKLCHRLVHEPMFRDAVKRDPEGTLASLPLTEQERGALLSGDVGTLFLLGAHPFLLGHLQRYQLFGLNAALYTQRIKEAAARGGV